jgi:3-oxoacyl-[acyl-carrier protein] reductase
LGIVSYLNNLRIEYIKLRGILMKNNKVALITGSSRGIGKAIALRFAKEGMDVVINYNNSKLKAENVVKSIRKMGVNVIAINCDVSNENAVKNMVAKVIKIFGRIDVLVNNAGIVYDIPLFKKTTKQWKRVFDVNLNGTYFCSKYVAQHMLKQGYGDIINISSTNGISTISPESADYDASKAAIISFTKNLAEELAPKIKVNCIAPGWILTDMNKKLTKEYIKEEEKKISLKRFGNPEEIASVAFFLLSKDASYINGSVLVVDGGYK